MCGIVGYKGFSFNKEIINGMIASIRHRGPNGSGYLLQDDIAIGMTRLSIIDIAGGDQPIYSQNRRYAIIFNGEIYNYKELQQEIRSAGKILVTDSDTEVILALYEMQGAAAVEKLRGMFAFVILDMHTNQLFIARDRVGKKPLYYWHEGNKFAFASEIKGLLKIPALKANITPNMTAIKNYLHFRYSPGPETMFTGIKKFPSAHWMHVTDAGIELQEYWTPHFTPEIHIADRDALGGYQLALDEAVRVRMMGEVPVGAYLSGGVDSTSIVESMARQASGKVKTFTVGFGWEGDELDQARQTAALIGTEHYEIECRAKHIEQLADIIWQCDEPLGDPIVIPTFLLAQEAKRHVTVALSGEGADELFGGYAFHKVLLTIAQYKKICPKFLHQYVISPLFSAIPTQLLNLMFQYPAYLGKSGKDKIVDYVKHVQDRSPQDNFYDLISLFTESEKRAIYTPEFYASGQDSAILRPHTILENPTLQDFIEMQFDHWLPDNMLMRQDKTSMAHGLEVRVPFMDNKMIEYSYAISPSMKIGKGINKRIVRESLKQRLKGYNAGSKKVPFYFPFENLYASEEFTALVDTYLNEEAIRKRGYFRTESIRQLLAQMHNRNFLAAKQIFAIISLEIWHQIYFD